jgi:hypothetical protein
LRACTDGAVDLFRHPYLRQTAAFALYLTTPDLGAFSFGDNPYAPPSAELLALLAARTDDPHAQELAVRLRAWHPLVMTWGRHAPEPRPLDDLPRTKHFSGAGATVMRSGWSGESVYVGLKTGRTTANHSHLDINSLLLTALGEPLLVDSGRWTYDGAGGSFGTNGRRWDYPANATEGHSTLLVDGVGQRYGEAHFGEVKRLEATPALTYAVAQGAAAYGPEVRRFTRHLALAQGNCVLLADLVETSAPCRLTWLFQTPGKAELSESPQGRLKVEKGGAALDVDLLWPDAATGRTLRQVALSSEYLPAWEEHPSVQRPGLSYVAVKPLHRASEGLLVMVFRPRRAASPPAPSARLVARERGSVEIAVTSGDGVPSR